MKQTRFISLLLALCLTLPLFACGQGETATETGTADTVADTTAVETTPEEVDLYAGLGVADYEGYTVRILNTEEHKPFMVAEEQNGEAVNDAVFEANAKVMELANVILQQDLVADPNVTFKACVEAGDDAFDMAIAHDCNSAKRQMAGNYMMNLLTFPTSTGISPGGRSLPWMP